MPSLKTLLGGIFLLAFFPLLIYSENDKKQSSQSSTENNTMAKFNINNISTFIYNNGSMDINSGNSGFEYPLGSAKHLIYQSGLMWGGLVNGKVRAGGSFYRSGLSPGSILANGQPEPPNTASVRVYRVRRDYRAADFTNEMLDEGRSYDEIYLQYENDWKEWPADKGAPYEDTDNNGKYDPEIDIPGEPGALQTLWFSANDYESSAIFIGTSTRGMEVQTTVWGYKLSEYTDNAVFRRYRIINKSRDTLENTYLSLFIDSDIGDATDDLAGCDSSLNLVYGYNSNKNDSEYGAYVPAAGFVLLQGPITEGTASDIAEFKGRKVRGMKNLPMTSSSFAFKHGYDEGDFGYENPEGAYNYMQGLNLLGEPIRLPKSLGGNITKFIFSGDPETLEGWVDGIDVSPADRRSNISSGPFTFAPADTQEVIYACIAAGYENQFTNIDAVKGLKLSARILKNFYQDFQYIIDGPQIEIFESDREIVLNWEGNIDKINEIEGNNGQEIEFEGYNVYQAQSETPKTEEVLKVQTFDIVNGIKKIYHPYISLGLNSYAYKLAQSGSDSGIKRYIILNKDSFTNKYLANGSKYYFAVTSYYVDKKHDILLSYESFPKFFEVIPEKEKPGIRYGGAPGKNIIPEHISGMNDNFPLITVTDPAKLNGHIYEITFAVDAQDSATGQIEDITAEKQYSLDITNDKSAPGFGLNGLNIILFDNQAKGIDYVESPYYENLIGHEHTGFNLEGFYGAMGWSSPRQKFGDGKEGVSPRKLKKVELRFMEVQDTNFFNPQFNLDDPDLSFAYRYGRNFDKSPARPEFIENIINANPGFSYQDFTKSVPFSAWDVDDPLNPRRLAMAFLENNVNNGIVDGKYWPPTSYISNTQDTSACEWIWILDEDYSEVPNSAYQDNAIELDIPAMYWITAVRSYPNFWIKYTMSIHPHRLLNETDIYRFISPSNSYSTELAKADINKINVFPNPYYGRHRGETSRYESFVTFNHLPERAVIRIYNLGGQLVRTIYKNSVSQYEYWDLLNENDFQVGSGLYIAAIEMPDLGRIKVLKLAVIQRQIIPERF